MKKINIRELAFRDREVVFPLYSSVFGQDRLERWKKRLEWQFLKSPGTELVPPRMWVAERQDGRILGFIGSFAMRIKIGTREIVHSNPSDLMVSKEARHQGLGERLIQAYIASAYTLATAFGYSPAAGRIYRRLGYYPVYCEPIYVRPFDSKSIFRFLLNSGRFSSLFGKRQVFKFIQSVCGVLNKVIFISDKVRWPRKSKKLIVEEVRQIDCEFDNLWKRISHNFPVIVIRDRDFVKWRFIDDPIFKHTLLVARDLSGKLCGYLDFCVSMKRAMFIGRIMDIFCKPTSVAVIDSLLGRALELMKKRNIALISCMGLNPLIRERVKRFLYIKPKGLEIPTLIYCKKDNGINNLLYNENSWHLAHADGDEGFAP